MGFASYVIQYGPQLFEFYGQLGAKAEFTETRDVIGGKAQIIREPVGVVAIITPWNAPVPLISCWRRRGSFGRLYDRGQAGGNAVRIS